MRVLVAISFYGTKNLPYLHRLIDEYQSMDYAVDVVVLSEAPKELGRKVEVVVGLPTKDPWSLPFAHKKLFAERANDYDLYIYSEDDTLLTMHHIRAFLDATAKLPTDAIAGFLRYEQDTTGQRFCSSVHSHFHWDIHSLEVHGPYRCAHFTNQHAACYLLTQKQLRALIISGRFLVGPHHERYDMPCSAATDPYTCGVFRKLIPISHLEQFMLHHLPNRYLGKMGIALTELMAQVDTILHTPPLRALRGPLFDVEKCAVAPRFNKSYYEKPDHELMHHIPSTTRTLLSIGSGWGSLEAQIQQQGIKVVALPLDPVIAVSAQLRGIQTLSADFAQAAHELADQQFDVIVLSNVLQHLADPVGGLSWAKPLLKKNGRIIGSVPNMLRINTSKRLNLQHSGSSQKANLKQLYATTRLQFSTSATLRKWLGEAGFSINHLGYGFAPSRATPPKAALFAAGRYLGDSIVFAATAR
jgi:2-polyprenyl-3-methyl-5-hydroxy-6-metoxy-1,4-benzoquinol methylase